MALIVRNILEIDFSAVFFLVSIDTSGLMSQRNHLYGEKFNIPCGEFYSLEVFFLPVVGHHEGRPKEPDNNEPTLQNQRNENHVAQDKCGILASLQPARSNPKRPPDLSQPQHWLPQFLVSSLNQSDPASVVDWRQPQYLLMSGCSSIYPLIRSPTQPTIPQSMLLPIYH